MSEERTPSPEYVAQACSVDVGELRPAEAEGTLFAGRTTVAGTAEGRGSPHEDPERATVLALLSAPDAQGCRRWLGSYDDDGYPRVTWRGGWVAAHRLLYSWAHGPIPPRHEVHHACGHRWCMEVEHFEALPKGEHARREAQRRREDRQKAAEVSATGADEGPPTEPAAASTFAIAPFAGVDRPAVQPRTVSLDGLAQLLGRFEVLADKRRGHCWSSTQYAEGATSRGNAGVAAVSCLVFDLDRVPPDPERLDGVCWIGHTTWSHTPEKPRWRVVIPLARPVTTKRWANVWQRARAALCPEADPSRKDPSRQYYLPSHPRDTASESTVHAGPLLDPATLPELPPAPRPPKMRRVRVSGDRRRGEAYMEKVIDELAKTPPGRRNNALNHAAWTLGRGRRAGAGRGRGRAVRRLPSRTGLLLTTASARPGPRFAAGSAPACGNRFIWTPTTGQLPRSADARRAGWRDEVRVSARREAT